VLADVKRRGGSCHDQRWTSGQRGAYRFEATPFACNPGEDSNPSRYAVAGHMIALVNDRRAIVVVVTAPPGDPLVERFESSLHLN